MAFLRGNGEAAVSISSLISLILPQNRTTHTRTVVSFTFVPASIGV